MDLDDVNRNAKDGLHTAAMAGSWMSIVNGFGGMRAYDGVLSFDPKLPAQWDSYRFKVMNHGQRVDIFVDQEGVVYTLLESDSTEGLEIRHKGDTLNLLPGEPVRMPFVKTGGRHLRP